MFFSMTLIFLEIQESLVFFLVDFYMFVFRHFLKIPIVLLHDQISRLFSNICEIAKFSIFSTKTSELFKCSFWISKFVR